MNKLLSNIHNCTTCSESLPHEVNPVLSAHPNSKIIIIGQAPGAKVHKTGIPWNDQSGKNLKNWLEMDDSTFYNEEIVSLIPMGFCYPGKGKSGDLPPRKECAPLWHPQLLEKFTSTPLILLVGLYAQQYYLGKDCRKTLTETVKHYEDYLPNYFTLPHPSPRNNIWQAKNPWFNSEVLPTLKEKVKNTLL